MTKAYNRKQAILLAAMTNPRPCITDNKWLQHQLMTSFLTLGFVLLREVLRSLPNHYEYEYRIISPLKYCKKENNLVL